MKILSALLISARIALTSPALADNYEPPNNGHPSGTIGSGKRVSDCTYRGSDRREGCMSTTYTDVRCQQNTLTYIWDTNVSMHTDGVRWHRGFYSQPKRWDFVQGTSVETRVAYFVWFVSKYHLRSCTCNTACAFKYWYMYSTFDSNQKEIEFKTNDSNWHSFWKHLKTRKKAKNPGASLTLTRTYFTALAKSQNRNFTLKYYHEQIKKNQCIR